MNDWNATNANFSKKLFDTTYWISYSIAPSSQFCVESVLDIYLYVYNQTKVFNNITYWLINALQNLLANAITYNLIYEKIVQAQNANDTVAEMYWYGRLTYLIIIFEPMNFTYYMPNATNVSFWSSPGRLLEPRKLPEPPRLMQNNNSTVS